VGSTAAFFLAALPILTALKFPAQAGSWVLDPTANKGADISASGIQMVIANILAKVLDFLLTWYRIMLI
jgi:hypothetical protein